MKNILFISLFACLGFISCNTETKEVNSLADSLGLVNEGLKIVVSEKDSSIESFIVAFNEIQENLTEVKAKQKMISTNTSDAELKRNMKDQIIADIQSINELMEKNKQKISSLRSKLEKSNGKVDELEKMIAFMTTQMQEKDQEITDLKNQLERLNIEVAEITAKYEEKSEESNKKTEELNTAYFAIGTSKELKEKGVLTKEGGFIGLGKTKKLSADFNKSYFTKVDITQSKTFPINAKKAKLITTHPSSSYKIEGVKRADKLVIINAQEFWSASKYMVLIIED
jgi:DNA repair exonuclease SbcCD ATPase subunit